MKHFVEENYFTIVNEVSEIWTQVKSIPNYRKELGVELFTRMFKIAPNVWQQFPWGAEGTKDEDLLNNEKFILFAGQFMGMLDMAIDMLGPDLDLVESQLQKLGVRHIEYGVMPKHYPLMGRALSDTLENHIGEAFTSRLTSWNSIYTFMSISMMQGAFQQLNFDRKEYRKLKVQVREAKKRRDSQTSATSSAGTSEDGQDEKRKSGGVFGAWMKRLSVSSK